MINQSLFDTPIPRLSTGSEKWDGLEHFFGVADALPMWVADMDFAAPHRLLKHCKPGCSTASSVIRCVPRPS